MAEVGRVDALVDVPTSPKAQALCDLLMSPYTQHMAALNEKTDRATVLRELSPGALVTTLEQGVQLVLGKYAEALAPSTTNQLAHWLKQHTALAEKLNEPWLGVSRGLADELVRAVKVGFTAEEAALGATLGGAFGPAGRLIGSAIGGLFAFKRDNREEEERAQAYLAEVTHWVAVMGSDFDRRVLPRIERDLNPWRHRVRAAGFAFAVLVAVACAAWFLR